MSMKVSGFAAFVRLIGRGIIGGNLMKSIKTKSLFAILLSAFALSSCQDLIDDPLVSVSDTSSTAQSVTCSGGTSVPETSSSTLPQASLGEMDNGVIVIKQANEQIPGDGLSFRVDSLNEEFTLYLSRLYVKGEDKPFVGMLDSLFLADANKDGYLDFIYTTADGRSLKNAGFWVRVYDYHNDKELFRLDDPDIWDYEMNFEEHRIVVEKYNTDYFYSKNVLKLNRLVGKGVLDYSNPTIKVDWQNFLNADSFNINVTTADSSRTPITMRAGQRENTFVVEHATADKAYCITTNLVRNNGNYDDLLTDLPVGYYGDCLFVQAAANNHQDNVIVSFEGAIQGMEEETYFVEACVSGYEFEIYFDFDTLEDPSDIPTLMQTMGWNFSKNELIEYSHEYIPGGDFNAFSEEDYPFMYVSVAREGEATKVSYNLLEGTVAPIDPALVNGVYSVGHHKFKTSSQTYTLDECGPFFEYGTSFYLVTSYKDYFYATSNSETYYRFRDEHTEITVESYAGNGTKVLQNANKIIFKQETARAIEERVPDYKLTIAGNTFEIMDYKTMFKGSTRYTAVSSYDFSSLYA